VLNFPTFSQCATREASRYTKRVAPLAALSTFSQRSSQQQGFILSSFSKKLGLKPVVTVHDENRRGHAELYNPLFPQFAACDGLYTFSKSE
jgi:hypothetical protein